MAVHSRVGWWTEIEEMQVIDVWRADATLRARIHNLAPTLAVVLDNLASKSEEGPPRCPSTLPNDELVQCQQIFGHGPRHHWEDDCGTIEWWET